MSINYNSHLTGDEMENFFGKGLEDLKKEISTDKKIANGKA